MGDIDSEFGMIGKNNGCIRDLTELPGHICRHEWAMGVEYPDIALFNSGGDLRRERDTRRISLKNLSRDAGIPDDGVVKSLVIGFPIGWCDYNRIQVHCFQRNGVVHNGIGNPVNQWRKRIIQQTDSVLFFHIVNLIFKIFPVLYGENVNKRQT